MSLKLLQESPELKRAMIYKSLQVCPSLARGRDLDSAVAELCRARERKPAETIETSTVSQSRTINVLQFEEAMSCLAAGITKKHGELQSEIARRRVALDEEERSHRVAAISKLRSLLQMLAGVGEPLPEAAVARACAPLIEAMKLSVAELRWLLKDVP